MDSHDSDTTLTPLVQLEQGMVQGDIDRGIVCFKGMSYGASTAGNNRFRPPRPAIPWEGVRDATSFGPDAPQQNPAHRAVNRQDTSVQTSGVESEDCLVVNVWTPDLNAQHAVVRRAGRGRPGIAQTFAAVADGSILPHHPFDPEAPAISSDKPVIVGYNQTEATLFMGPDEGLNELDAEALQGRIEQLVGDKAADIIARYREAFPETTCSDLLALITTGNSRYPIDSIKLAERKAASGAAPVWLYTLTFRTTARRGAMRTPHALEIPFVFDGVDGSRRFVGNGEGPEVMAKQMSSTWIAFARTGDPNNSAIPEWKPYDLNERLTMVFNTESQLVEDFGKVERETFGPLFYGTG